MGTFTRFKWGWDASHSPGANPELKPIVLDVLALRLKTEPYINVEVEGTKFRFIVDTGAAISLIKPDKWQAPIKPTKLMARGVTGSDLELLGIKEVEMKIGPIKFEHKFLISDLGTPGDEILDVDLLQSVGASVDLDVGCLRIGDYKIPLESRDGTVLAVAISSDEGRTVMDPRTEELIIPTEERTDPEIPNIPEESTDSIPPWHAEVFLPETTLLPPLAVRIIRGRIVAVLQQSLMR